MRRLAKEPFKDVTIFELEGDGWVFTRVEGGYNCSIIQKGDELHIYRGYSAGSGEVDFSNSTEFDQATIKYFLNPIPENKRRSDLELR